MLKLIRSYPLIFLVLLCLLLAVFGANIAAFYTDFLWFGEVGQQSVFRRIYGTRVLLFALFGTASFLIAYANLRLADKFSPSADLGSGGKNAGTSKGKLWDKGSGKPADKTVRVLSGFRRVLSGLLLAAAAVFAIVCGLTAQGEWDGFLRFTHPVSFGIRDAQFGRDLSFYVFTLPFARFMQNWLLVVLLLVGVGVALLYLYQQGINSVAGRTVVAPHVRAHLSALAALALFVKAWDYYLDRYDLLYGGMGSLLPGAGYTDIHARLPMLMLLIGVTCLAGVAALANVWRRTIVLPAAAVGLWVAFSLAGVIIPGSVQRLRVRPNEAIREAPFIARAIEATRKAYDVDSVKTENFPASDTLTQADLSANAATLSNIRLWDYEPLLETYPQQQGFRQYYQFPDVDVDRYHLGGANGYQQVLLAAREIAPEALDGRAQTWPNLHLRYTHGFGVVMSPAGKVTSEGLPEFLLRDIPPVAAAPSLALTNPRIYYGIGTTPQTYVVVNTNQAEFDYPSSGDANAASESPADVETKYTGKGGIPLTPLAKFAFAVRFAGWTNLMLSSDITKESRLLFARRVPDRIKRVAPFLLLDHDPYPVVADGRVVWVQDAYTVSGAYPYSAPVDFGDDLSRGRTINYIRNSVKATVDAYDGSVHLYAADTTDPILRSYQKIFPGLISPAAQMPNSIRTHRRYPEDLFSIQRRVLSDYHVTDANVWYSRADSWQAARSQSTVEGGAGGTARAPGADAMAPYYVILRLPGEKTEEFALVSPFTPRDRENMVSLLTARCDGAAYGQKVLYRFPASRLISGPQQVGKRIRSDSKISPYLSLNDQKGSTVLFGSMLIVPIEQSVLYVQPLYVKASGAGNADMGTNSIPELKQVVVAFENRIAMEPTLPAALADLFGAGTPGTTPAAPTGPAPTGGAVPTSSAALIEQAGAQYEKAQAALRAGDFAEYGRQSKALGETLKALRGAKGAGVAPNP